MQNGDVTDAATAAEPAAPAVEAMTKHSFRQSVWRHLETSGLAVFPRPVYRRIPNFKGAAEAADKLAETDAFKNAKTVWVNPDKPQEFVRIKVLEAGKTLYVPTMRQQDGYLSRVELPGGDVDYKKAVSRGGMAQYGKLVNVDVKVSVDLIVVGSVAVTRDGYRIGNGRGLSDLELGLLIYMGGLSPTCLVATVVHDSQVFDSAPHELFGAHDMPVDLIATNTKTIATNRTCARPTGILWHLISSRRLGAAPLLIKLRDIEMAAGRPCPLKEVDTDPEDRATLRMRRRRRFTRSQSGRKSEAAADGEVADGQNERKPRRVSRRRRSSVKSQGKDESATTPTKPRRLRKPRPQVDFSLKVSNITKNTRVRDLKMALADRGVKPQIMVWKGFRGFCYLHFLKNHPLKDNPQKEKVEGEDEKPDPVWDMESVLKALEGVLVREGASSEAGPPTEPYAILVEVAPPREDKPPKVVDEILVAPTGDATAV